MSGDFNEVRISGVIKDIQPAKIVGRSSVVKFRLITKDEKGNSMLVTCEGWGDVGHQVSLLKNESNAFVSGKLLISKYTDPKTNVEKYFTVIRLKSILGLNDNPMATAVVNTPAEEGFDDIPF